MHNLSSSYYGREAWNKMMYKIKFSLIFSCVPQQINKMKGVEMIYACFCVWILTDSDRMSSKDDVLCKLSLLKAFRRALNSRDFEMCQSANQLVLNTWILYIWLIKNDLKRGKVLFKKQQRDVFCYKRKWKLFPTLSIYFSSFHISMLML